MRNHIIVCINKAKSAFTHMGQCIRRHTVLAAVLLLLTALISPKEVQGQLPSPCCAVLAAGLGTINSTLGSVIGGGLQAINSVLSDISNFEQTVIWPKQAIAQAFGIEVDPIRWTVFDQFLFGRQALVLMPTFRVDRASVYIMSTWPEGTATLGSDRSAESGAGIRGGGNGRLRRPERILARKR